MHTTVTSTHPASPIQSELTAASSGGFSLEEVDMKRVIIGVVVAAVALVGCGDDGTGSRTAEPAAVVAEPDDGPDDDGVAEEFTSAFVDGDVDRLAELSTGIDALGAIPWRAEFLAALDLEADSVECVEDGAQTTCMVVGHNARTRLLAPDVEVKRSLHLTIEDGVVSRGSFEFASPDMAPIFEAFNQWALANRRDVIDGPCADIDGTSDPAECAAAVLEVTQQYLADSDA